MGPADPGGGAAAEEGVSTAAANLLMPRHPEVPGEAGPRRMDGPAARAVARRGLLCFRLGPTKYALSALVTWAVLHAGARADDADLGRELYDDVCATCHGRDMVNPGGVTFDLRKFPKDDFERF